jgi:hypothetical protein
LGEFFPLDDRVLLGQEADRVGIRWMGDFTWVIKRIERANTT